jgi:guanylate kinase
MRNKVVITLTGPSASGKSTLERMLTRAGAGAFTNCVSHTTRMPREGEVHGSHYYFVDEADFVELNRQGCFVEAVGHSGVHYGLSVTELERAFACDQIPIVVCEPVGQAQVQDYCDKRGWAVLSVFVDNPAQVRYERLVARFIADIQHLALGSSEFGHRAASFAKRLAAIETIESRWGDSAGDRYRMVFRHFNAANRAQVAQAIVGEAFALQAVVEPVRRQGPPREAVA